MIPFVDLKVQYHSIKGEIDQAISNVLESLYPIPVHLLEARADLGHKRGHFSHSERAADEVLSLPMYAELTEEQIQEVSSTVGSP